MSLLFFFALLSAGNTLYYQFYSSFVSVNLISTASMIGKVDDSLFAKIHLIQFIYLICPIVFLLFRKKLFNNSIASDLIDSLKDKKIFRLRFMSIPCIFVLIIAFSI